MDRSRVYQVSGVRGSPAIGPAYSAIPANSAHDAIESRSRRVVHPHIDRTELGLDQIDSPST